MLAGCHLERRDSSLPALISSVHLRLHDLGALVIRIESVVEMKSISMEAHFCDDGSRNV